MSPEELRERLERAGLTPYRLSYLLGVEPNEGSKWTRGDRPVPKGRVSQIIELTDFVAEHGAAAVPLPSLVRTANARIARRETGVLRRPMSPRDDDSIRSIRTQRALAHERVVRRPNARPNDDRARPKDPSSGRAWACR